MVKFDNNCAQGQSNIEDRKINLTVHLVQPLGFRLEQQHKEYE